MTTTLNAKPVKGTVWEHPFRKDWDGSALVLTVTSVTQYKGQPHVYSLSGHRSVVKTPLEAWVARAKVLSVPEPTPADTEPKLTDAQYEALFAKAHAAGTAAGETVTPTPMHVVQRANPFDDNSPIVKAYAPVMDGVCGFAYVTIRPGNGPCARWMRKTGRGYAGYYGGRTISVRYFGQSMTRKEAYAAAFAAVLKEAGIKAYSESRLD